MEADNRFQRIHEAIEEPKRRFFESRLTQAMLSGTLDVTTYKVYLRETFHFTRHTPRFLAAAASRFDYQYEPIRKRFLKHCLEEYGHDQMALRDLVALGVKKESVYETQPLIATQAMVAFHYYIAERENPVGLFGMIYVLEGLAQDKAPDVAKILVESAGIPKNATTFIEQHGELDIGHLEAARRTIQDHVRLESDMTAVLNCARGAYELYVTMFDAIWDHAKAHGY